MLDQADIMIMEVMGVTDRSSSLVSLSILVK